MIICVNGIFLIPTLRSCITYHFHFSPHSMKKTFCAYTYAGMYVCLYVYQLCLCMLCMVVVCVWYAFWPMPENHFFLQCWRCVCFDLYLMTMFITKVAGVCVYFDPYLMFMFITMLQVCMFWTMPCNHVYHSVAGVHACLFWLVLKSCLSQCLGRCVCVCVCILTRTLYSCLSQNVAGGHTCCGCWPIHYNLLYCHVACGHTCCVGIDPYVIILFIVAMLQVGSGPEELNAEESLLTADGLPKNLVWFLFWNFCFVNEHDFLFLCA